MAPNVRSGPVVASDVPDEEIRSPAKPQFKTKIVWKNVLLFIFLHLAALYGQYLALTSVMWKSIIFGLILGNLGGISVTAGCHRLWCHRTYKAKWPLRLFLAVFNLVAAQNDIHEWSRDHRVHHKFSDTDADPHNSKRGFFFAHMGWLMCKKHPDVIAKGKSIDMSDVASDPIVKFQARFYKPLTIFFSFYLPTVIPNWLWGETYWNAFFVCAMLRYCLTLHGTWLVNSAAHYYGDRPYDKRINARENFFVIALALGEGFHNYHHTFPWDYSTSEFGRLFNLTTAFIDFMAWLGLAYDLRTAGETIRKQRMETAGDGSRPWYAHSS